MIEKGLFLLIFGLLFVGCSQAKVVENNLNVHVVNLDEAAKKINVDCEKCKIDYVRYIKLNINNLDSISVINFLCTIDESCTSKVEFSQFSNKVLFMLLLNYPDLTVELLAKYDFQLDRICNKLSHPIHDGIDIDGVANLLKAKKTHQQTREKLLHSLPGY